MATATLTVFALSLPSGTIRNVGMAFKAHTASLVAALVAGGMTQQEAEARSLPSFKDDTDAASARRTFLDKPDNWRDASGTWRTLLGAGRSKDRGAARSVPVYEKQAGEAGDLKAHGRAVQIARPDKGKDVWAINLASPSPADLPLIATLAMDEKGNVTGAATDPTDAAAVRMVACFVESANALTGGTGDGVVRSSVAEYLRGRLGAFGIDGSTHFIVPDQDAPLHALKGALTQIGGRGIILPLASEQDASELMALAVEDMEARVAKLGSQIVTAEADTKAGASRFATLAGEAGQIASDVERIASILSVHSDQSASLLDRVAAMQARVAGKGAGGRKGGPVGATKIALPAATVQAAAVTAPDVAAVLDAAPVAPATSTEDAAPASTDAGESKAKAGKKGKAK